MRKVKNRIIIGLLIGLSVSELLFTEPTGERLKTIAERLGLCIGYASVTNFTMLSDAPTYQNVATSEFNLVTPEHALKLDTISPSQNYYNFSAGDQLVQFAWNNGLKVHGHCLVWHSAQPAWLVNIRDRTQLLTALYKYIDSVLNHFKGKILVWDVVNEALNEDGSYRNSFWSQVIGKDFIELAFQRARQADPAAKLIYNDYNIEVLGKKSDSAYNIIADMVRRGIPIDGVGLQMHLTDQGIDYQSFADNMTRFAALGLEIYITEMDVRIPDRHTESDLQNQADIYRQIFKRCLTQPAVKAIQVWGVTDKYSWIPSTYPGTGSALLFDNEYNAKAAYYAVQDVLANPPTPTPTPTATPVIGKMGDVNGDNLININDALFIARYCAGFQPDVFSTALADVNRNGSIQITDALLIAQCSAGIIPCSF
jgi:endo-1,4-beta-xylanase